MRPFNPSIVLALLLICGCAGRNEEWNPRPMVMPKPGELDSLKARAMRGDPYSALQLSLWYSKFPEGRNTDFYWTQIAAENGNEIGQYNLALFYMDEKNKISDMRAEYWLKKSADKGAIPAKNKLAELARRKPQP